MNCRKVQNLISAYVDCELPGVEMLAVRQHLSGCAECNSEYESLLRMKRAFGSLHPKNPTAGLADRIFLRLDQLTETPQERAASAFWKHLTFFPGKVRLAAATIGIIAVMLTVRSGQIYSTNYGLLPPTQPAQVASFGEGDPVALFPAAAHVRGAHLVTAPSPAPAEPWELSHVTASSTSSSAGSITLAGYSTP